MKNRSIVVLILFVFILGVAMVPIMAQEEAAEIPDPALVYSSPEGYETVGNNTLQMGAETIIVIDTPAYELVLGNEEFEDEESALSFFLDRTGYSVGGAKEVTGDNVIASFGVALARREQQGLAFLVDLGLGMRAVVVSLHTGRGRVGAPPADSDVVINSVAYSADLVQAVGADESLSILGEAITAAGLEETFHGAGPFTVFAPNNDAFETLLVSLGISKEQLLAANYLDDILLYHVVAGSVDSATLAENYLDQTSIPTALTLNNIRAFSGSDGEIFLNNSQVQVVSTDFVATNGVVHVVSGVLLPQCAIDAINGAGGCD